MLKKQGEIEFEVIERSPERVVSEMPIHAGLKNPFGVVQAGAILWLADVSAAILVLGATPASHGAKGFPLTVNLSANFVGNQKEGRLRAVSTFVKRGRTISVVRTGVYGDGDRSVAEIVTNHVLSR